VEKTHWKAESPNSIQIQVSSDSSEEVWINLDKLALLALVAIEVEFAVFRSVHINTHIPKNVWQY